MMLCTDLLSSKGWASPNSIGAGVTQCKSEQSLKFWKLSCFWQWYVLIFYDNNYDDDEDDDGDVDEGNDDSNLSPFLGSLPPVNWVTGHVGEPTQAGKDDDNFDDFDDDLMMTMVIFMMTLLSLWTCGLADPDCG